MKHTYFPSAKDDERRRNAINKAENRGKVAVEWFNAGNKLTMETQPEFNLLMKQADKEFDASQL